MFSLSEGFGGGMGKMGGDAVSDGKCRRFRNGSSNWVERAHEEGAGG